MPEGHCYVPQCEDGVLGHQLDVLGLILGVQTVGDAGYQCLGQGGTPPPPSSHLHYVFLVGLDPSSQGLAQVFHRRVPGKMSMFELFLIL